MVDAVRSDPAHAGSVHRIEVSNGTELRGWTGAGAGSHALGVGSAVALGQALDHMPTRLVVFGIEGADWGHGDAVSENVEEAVAEVAARVAAEIEGVH